MQELDERLAAVAAFVPFNAHLADIGTDHAKLPLALISMGKIKKAIATDVNIGPLEAAKRAVKMAGQEKAVDVRLSDGFCALKMQEADTVTIAGMGGALICRILQDAGNVLFYVKNLILQPQNGAEQLRAWLYANDWHIADENLAYVGNRLYEIILAQKGRSKSPAPPLLSIGPLLWQKKPPLLKMHIKKLLKSAKCAAAGMEKNARAGKSPAYRALKEKIALLEEKISW